MIDFALNTSPIKGQPQPCADALLSSTLFTAVWADSGVGIKGRHVDPTGMAVGQEFPVSDTSPADVTERRWPFADSTGVQTFVVWIEQPPSNQPHRAPHVVLRRIIDSPPVGPPVQVGTGSIDPAWPPTVTRTIDGGCLVTWTGGGAQQRIRAQRFGPDCRKEGSEIAVNTSEALHGKATVTLLSNGDFVVGGPMARCRAAADSSTGSSPATAHREPVRSTPTSWDSDSRAEAY
ncbi:hypothetical protein ACFV5G_09830 [Streptomyces sp. NPDC059766]|uniref:hypothetical protein n=1 Tax=Streptomyces sp. NPDC059766 TaxID=3346940 RepID=UPI003655ED32